MTVGETFTWLRRASPIGRIQRQTWERIAIACLFGAAILFPIAHRNDGDIDAAANALTFAALALGLNIVVGLAGLLDLGYVAFFAVGAYSWAILGSPHGNVIFGGGFPLPAWMFFVFLFVGLLVAAVTGVLLGLPVLRLRGDYLAIVTLGFGEVI